MKISFLYFALAAGIPSVALADETVRIPARCPIASIGAELFRSENSKVTIQANPKGTMIQYGESPVLFNHGQASARYSFTVPAELSSSRKRAYTIKVGGSFSTGSDQGWVHPTSSGYPPKTRTPTAYVVHLYGGTNEPPNTDLTINFKHHC